MEIRRREDREEELLARMRNRPRLEGQHLTDAVYCNVKAWAFPILAALGVDVRHDDSTLLRFLVGQGMGMVLEEGRVSQIPSLSPDDASVGTIDVWLGTHPAEVKATWTSTRKPIAEMDHWLTQIGGYAARTMRPDHKTMKAEIWSVHLAGDHGKKHCLKHGVPEEEMKAKHPDTGRPRLICPVCANETGEVVFLSDGDRDPALRCHEIRWSREELESLHSLLTWRQAELQSDIGNSEYSIGNPPPWKWGYDFECAGCAVKDKIGCPGKDTTETEEELHGSLAALEKEMVTT